MAYKTGILLVTFFFGSFGLPKPATDVTTFYGHSDPTGRIMGGSAAGLVPYMVAITDGFTFRTFLCGGSLVGPSTVLTAAHCINAVYSAGSLSDELQGYVGAERWIDGVAYNFVRNISHPNYVQSDIKNDIGLLITDRKVVLSNSVQIIPLNYDYIGAGVASRVTGWGRIQQGGSSVFFLQQLVKNTIDGARCVSEVARVSLELNSEPAEVQPHIELCTFHSENHGTCHGDSGGPLVRLDLNQQIGVVSWGLPCARGAPDVFVRISAYKSWLQQNIR